jgi:alpha-L-fucosidase
VHLYFSIIDWNHKGYRSGAPKTDAERAEYDKFLSFTRLQLIELLERYPAVKGLWFDGSWDRAWIEQAAWVDALGEELRAMRPGLIIGSRFRADENGKRHYDTNGDLIDDYDQTWERALPDDPSQIKGVDWDCCMTLPENQWGYQRNWRGHIKTPFELLEMTAKAVSLGGNLVVNFGPDALGNIRPEETRIAAETGKWMKVNGEALYGATPATGLKKQGWGYYTLKGDKLYLTVFNRPLDNRVRVELPRGWKQPSSAKFLDSGKEAELIDAGRNKANDRLWQVAVPAKYKSDGPFVIVLELGAGKDNIEYDQAKI